LIQRQVRLFGLDVPERGVDGRDRRHRHRAAPPIGAAVEVLPDVFDLRRVATDERGDDVVGEVARDGKLAAVERRVADAGEARIRLDLQRDEVAARTGDDDARGGDLGHGRDCNCRRERVKFA
jgi:hypothetical protein